MRKVRIELLNRPGFTMILAALMFVVFLGAAVMAVDVGHMRLIRADLHAAADAAALAGIEKYASTSDSVLARQEAQLYAGKFKADVDTLTIASHTIGGWDSTKAYPAAFVALGTAGSTVADDVVVQHPTKYFFAEALAGHIQQHTASATSIAIGVSQKSISKSSCVAPVVMSFGDMLKQIGLGQGLTDSLSVADIDSLVKANSGKAVKFDIPNGTKVNSLGTDEFYQINVPPLETANGTHQADGPPSASDFKNGFTCGGSVAANAFSIGVGDWVEPINGQKANQAKQGIGNLGTLPVTFEVALAATFGNSPDNFCQGCFQIKYLASFTVTAVGQKDVTGYFNVLSPPAGGIVTSGSGSGPLELITKTRLVF